MISYLILILLSSSSSHHYYFLLCFCYSCSSVLLLLLVVVASSSCHPLFQPTIPPACPFASWTKPGAISRADGINYSCTFEFQRSVPSPVKIYYEDTDWRWDRLPLELPEIF